MRLVGRALEPGHDHDLAQRQLLGNARRVHVGDARAPVAAVCEDARLGAGQRDRRAPQRVQRHRHQRAAHVLAGRQQEIHLAGIGLVSDLRRHLEQVIGGVAHCADHHDEVGAAVALAGDPPRHVLDAVGVGERRATVFLDHQAGHGRDCMAAQPPSP